MPSPQALVIAYRTGIASPFGTYSQWFGIAIYCETEPVATAKLLAMLTPQRRAISKR
ncbi:hypothetical protein [Mastigocoleus sp. MO_188.B34]|uniref:hypothetical protein n=1 Tax=Mastigocoleus sp. MO_188.B34 TaxID=3036635 RepID=UPI002632D949|nr:hypothetical protein [Mastigocoleus sp. MO_188.B34]MDJ0695480.1 hypothetical protein [Mastigocoleus sp. MO_188.B34]